MVRVTTAVVLFVSLLPTAARAQLTALDWGPHAVGFRTVDAVDRSRIVVPRADFEGKPAEGETAMPLAIAMWYPAAPPQGATRMTTGDYRSLARQRLNRAEIIAAWRTQLGFARLKVEDAALGKALEEERQAVRDAPPKPGRFPLIVSGFESAATSSALPEYLASHGYVVVTAPSSARTAAQQAVRPLAALETQTRNLEFLQAWARELPFADDRRLGIVGLNFDGMAALLFELRNMRANAVVSIDGWEGKANGTRTLKQTPWYDPLRMRVPYLVFEQDEPSAPPALALDRSIFNELKYSTRQWFVLSGFGHAYLVGDNLMAPGLPQTSREAYVFHYQTVRAFLDTHVKQEPSAPPEAPGGLVKMQERAEALPPAPTADEFDRLISDGSVARAAEAYRKARAANPSVVVADEATLNLYAFRFAQRKQVEDLLAVRRLTAEAFPQSALAAFNLGMNCIEAGRPDEGRPALERALSLLDSDTRISQADKAQLRARIQKALVK